MDYYILDENNQPKKTGMYEYYDWKESLPEETQTGMGVQIDRTERGGVSVSTVYLGLDHGWMQPAPVLWETMVFGGEHDRHCERWMSHEDAVNGHKKVCEVYLPKE